MKILKLNGGDLKVYIGLFLGIKRVKIQFLRENKSEKD